MPLGFPSHQGLIAPLWRRWPKRFNILALCIGAGAPDAVDGIIGAFRGHLGQTYGHTLLGMVVLCLPLGLFLTALTVVLGGRLRRRGGEGFPGRVGRGIQRIDGRPERDGMLWLLVFWSWSIEIGAFSHLCFDFISHGNFLWFYPWYSDRHFFPSWWYARWIEIPVPGYRKPHALGPPLLIWIVLSILGIVLLLRPWFAGKKGGKP